MWLFTIEVTYKGRKGTYPYYVKLVENHLWKLRNLFAAAGMTIPQKRVKVDPNKVVGKFIGATLQDSEYNGRIQSEVQYVLPLDKIEAYDGDLEDQTDDEVEDDEDEHPGGLDEFAGDEEDEEEEDEESEEDRQKRLRRERAAARKAQAEAEAAAAAEELDEDEEDEEEEETPAPRRTKKAAAPARGKTAKKATSAKRPAPAVDDDELEDLDLDDL
jgi:type IV secretory pathway VirB10-like protein